mmetsp:Transcript_88756/g.192214  ORF Transcript_88756/g.192214 Transcript_88756/m.192214 type:complete len:98 (+) Transcript_88756:85-378(+)
MKVVCVHPNVVTLAGAIDELQHKAFNQAEVESSLQCVVMELCACDLFTVLHHPKKRVVLTLKQKLEILVQIASALQHIHSLSLVWWDLKSQNVLVRN